MQKARRTISTSAEELLKAHTPEWMALPGVLGTAIGLVNGKTCIKVYVSAKTETLLANIPGSVEGVDVRLVETGEIRPL